MRDGASVLCSILCNCYTSATPICHYQWPQP